MSTTDNDSQFDCNHEGLISGSTDIHLPLVQPMLLRNGSPIKLLQKSPALPSSSTVSINDILNLYIKTSPTTEIIESATSSTVSDILSPLAGYSFSPNNSDHQLFSMTREKVVEELLESETNYVTSLQLLLNFYIEPLIFSKGRSECFYIVRNHLERLQTNHTKLLNYMNSVLMDLEMTSNSLLVSSAFATGICKYGIDINTYEEFIIMYEMILKLVKHISNLPNDEQYQIINGSESYLEAIQPSTKRMDLSFFSLMQRPVSRISKYRLMIETCLKYTNIHDQNYENMNHSLNIIRQKLFEINKYQGDLAKRDLAEKLNEILNIDRPIEYFGNCFLSGSMIAVWIEDGIIRSGQVLILCFKSHLLVALFNKNHIKRTSSYISKNSNNFNNNSPICNLNFIIPFSMMQITFDKYVNSIEKGGMITMYPYCIKIRFEKNYCKYELQFLAINKKEHEIWKQYLQTYSFINGPNKLDYSSSNYSNHILLKFPDNLSPYDVHLLRASNSLLALCYFSNIYRIGIILFGDNTYELEGNDELDGNSGEEKFNHENIQLRELERLEIENSLKSVWSQELPKLLDEIRTIKLRRSWSWISSKEIGKPNSIATGKIDSGEILLQSQNISSNTYSFRRSRSSRSETDLAHSTLVKRLDTSKFLTIFQR